MYDVHPYSTSATEEQNRRGVATFAAYSMTVAAVVAFVVAPVVMTAAVLALVVVRARRRLVHLWHRIRSDGGPTTADVDAGSTTRAGPR